MEVFYRYFLLFAATLVNKKLSLALSFAVLIAFAIFIAYSVGRINRNAENTDPLKAEKDKLGLQMLDSCMQPREDGGSYQICDQELAKIRGDCDTFKQTCADPRLGQYFALRASSSFSDIPTSTKEESGSTTTPTDDTGHPNIDTDYSRKLDSCLEMQTSSATTAERIDCDQFVGSTLYQFCSGATEYHAVCNDDRRSKFQSMNNMPIYYNIEIAIIDPDCDQAKATRYASAFDVDLTNPPQKGITAVCLTDKQITGFSDIQNTVIPEMRRAGDQHQILFAYPEEWKPMFREYFDWPFSYSLMIGANGDRIGVGYAPDDLSEIYDVLCRGSNVHAIEALEGELVWSMC